MNRKMLQAVCLALALAPGWGCEQTPGQALIKAGQAAAKHDMDSFRESFDIQAFAAELGELQWLLRTGDWPADQPLPGPAEKGAWLKERVPKNAALIEDCVSKGRCDSAVLALFLNVLLNLPPSWPIRQFQAREASFDVPLEVPVEGVAQPLRFSATTVMLKDDAGQWRISKWTNYQELMRQISSAKANAERERANKPYFKQDRDNPYY